MNSGLNRSGLIERLASRYPELSENAVEESVKVIIEQMTDTLSSGRRIEIRGFGSFALNYRAPRMGRNPKTGSAVEVAAKYVPHFKAGKALRDEVNDASAS